MILQNHATEYNIESINKDAQIFEWLKDGKKIYIHTQNTSSFYSDLVTVNDAYTELSSIYNDQQLVNGILISYQPIKMKIRLIEFLMDYFRQQFSCIVVCNCQINQIMQNFSTDCLKKKLFLLI